METAAIAELTSSIEQVIRDEFPALSEKWEGRKSRISALARPLWEFYEFNRDEQKMEALIVNSTIKNVQGYAMASQWRDVDAEMNDAFAEADKMQAEARLLGQKINLQAEAAQCPQM